MRYRTFYLNLNIINLIFLLEKVMEQVTQHVPLDQYSNNLDSMIQSARAKNSNTFIILITPPPVDEEKLKVYNQMKKKLVLVDRINERTRQYAQVCIILGQKVVCIRTQHYRFLVILIQFIMKKIVFSYSAYFSIKFLW